MDYSKMFLFLSSSVFVGFCQSLGGGDPADSMPCVKELLPCQPYLKAPTNPPASCCIPLKKMVTDETQCLCEVFTNPQILKSLNITQDDGLNLSKACGTNADMSVCKNADTPAGSPSSSTPTNSSSSSNSTTSSTESAANGMSHFGGAGFIGFFVAFVISAVWAS